MEPHLQAVLDHPDDDAPRLAYANWCGGDRAEFIRLQVKHADDAPIRNDDDYGREQQLLEAHEAEWTRALTSAHAWRFRRGFVEWVEADGASWLENGGAWLEAAPITQLRVRNLRPVMAHFFADEHLSRIRSLYLTDCQLEDGDVEVLAGSPQLRNVERLELSFNRIGAAGAEALARSPNLGSLRTLGFNGNRVELLPTASRDWDGSVQSVEVPDLLLDLVKRYGPKPWLS